MLRLRCWNLWGGPVDAQLAHLLLAPDTDVLVLTEYRRLRPCDAPSPTLATRWPHQHTEVGNWGPRGVLIASRQELEVIPAEAILRSSQHRDTLRPYVAVARLPGDDLTVVGVYMPHADGPPKEALWAALRDFAAAHQGERFIIAGDMNSCALDDAESGYPSSPDAVAAMGKVTVDAWVRINGEGRLSSDRYTWYGQGKGRRFGRRLDYAFLNPALAPALLDARHDHSVRDCQLSDHSALIVDLAI